MSFFEKAKQMEEETPLPPSVPSESKPEPKSTRTERTPRVSVKQIEELKGELAAQKAQTEMLLGAFLIPPEQRRLVDTFARMSERAREWALGFGILLDALEKTREKKGTKKLKKQLFLDIEEKTGSDAFKWVWRFCLKFRILIPENKLTEEEMKKLNVTKTTGGRHVYDYTKLQ